MTKLYHLRPIGLEALQGAQVHGVGGKDYIAGVQEHAGADIDSLLGRCSNLHLRHWHAITRSNKLPQLRDALRGAVLQRLGAVFLQHPLREAGDIGQGEGARRRVATREGTNGRKVHLAEDFPHGRPQEGRNVGGKVLAIVHEISRLRSK